MDDVPSAASEMDSGLESNRGDEEGNRGRKLLLLLLLLSICCVGALFGRYLIEPEALPDLLPVDAAVLDIPPHYLFSIYGAEQPVGVAVSPDGSRIYVSESGGERMIKIFDSYGDLIGAFAPPYIDRAQRSPVYLDTDSAGRVFVADRSQHAIFVYSPDGVLLDAMLSPDLTLSEFLAENDRPSSGAIGYNAFGPTVYYGDEQAIDGPHLPENWAPLGVRIDGADRLLVTDVARDGYHVVREIPPSVVTASSWETFDPSGRVFGSYGERDAQFIYPNVAVTDALGRTYVVDGNNGRVSVWGEAGVFRFQFGHGGGEGSLSLPRGATVDERDRLYVVDTVGQNVEVYDVSEEAIRFSFAFGSLGSRDGQFSYPTDIAYDDASGRLYIADRENNRVQVWLY